jgi:hypothetical protein
MLNPVIQTIFDKTKREVLYLSLIYLTDNEPNLNVSQIFMRTPILDLKSLIGFKDRTEADKTDTHITFNVMCSVWNRINAGDGRER